MNQWHSCIFHRYSGILVVFRFFFLRKLLPDISEMKKESDQRTIKIVQFPAITYVDLHTAEDLFPLLMLSKLKRPCPHLTVSQSDCC